MWAWRDWVHTRGTQKRVVKDEEHLDGVLGDVAKHVIGSPVLDFRMGSHNRTLEDKNLLGILVENCVDILYSKLVSHHNVRRRISNLLEPNFKRSVEDGNEWNGLLTWTLSNREEVSLVLSGNELGRSSGVLLERLLGEYAWLVEGSE